MSRVRLTALTAVGSGLAVAALFLTTAEPAAAQGLLGDILQKDPSKIGLGDIQRILIRLIQYTLAFAAAIGVISLVVNGYQYVIAAGNPEKLEKAKLGLTWSIGGFILALSAFAIVSLLQATLLAKQKVSDISPDAFGTPRTASGILEQLFFLLLLFGGATAVIFLILGGYRYIISQGNPEVVEKAKKTILYSGIGVILIFAAFGLFATFLRAVGAPGRL